MRPSLLFVALLSQLPALSSAQSKSTHPPIERQPLTPEQVEIEAILNNKAATWLKAMDEYIATRSSELDDELLATMQGIFTDPFYYEVYDADGNALFPEAASYKIADWISSQAIDTAAAVEGTMLAPPYAHYLIPTEDPDVVKLIGYHEHIWTGDFVIAFRTTREVGLDEFVFTRVGDDWLARSYKETVSEASACSDGGTPAPCNKPPLVPGKGHSPNLPLIFPEASPTPSPTPTPVGTGVIVR
ncbi:MAG: hypothetical protein SF028_07640 [Candidatus Sumerlaeia bacterium]|nr:hypothetical protein [Candidatus Sumerlaeia bacterium]